MKKNKKIIIFILLSVFISISWVFAYNNNWFWLAWNWVKWIWSSETWTWRYMQVTVWWVSAYLDTFTWLKWEANPTIGSSNPAWSSNTAYPEPVWDGTKYIRTRTTISASWYLTWTTILTGHTDYPAFALCVSKWAWWRLPTKRELFSIMTASKPTWMTYYTALPSITSPRYWSATMDRSNTTGAWYGYFYNGSTDNLTKTFTNSRSICIHD